MLSFLTAGKGNLKSTCSGPAWLQFLAFFLMQCLSLNSLICCHGEYDTCPQYVGQVTSYVITILNFSFLINHRVNDFSVITRCTTIYLHFFKFLPLDLLCTWMMSFVLLRRTLCRAFCQIFQTGGKMSCLVTLISFCVR